MTKKKTEKPLPPIPELTPIKANQLMCADYLRSIAGMIERGQILAFDLSWSTTIRKPLGKHVFDAEYLIAPVESKFLKEAIQMQKQEEAQQAKGISFEDVTEQLQDHEPCPDDEKDDCALCNTKCS